LLPRGGHSVDRSNEALVPSIESMTIVAGAFLLAGFVKGVIGLGLPAVSLAVLTTTLGLKSAMAILLAPSFVTNVWQALVGGHLLAIIRRVWMLLLAVCIATWLGVGVLARSNADVLAGLLGVVLFGYAVLGLMRLDLPRPGRLERWLSPMVGLASGLLNGMTGSFVVPGVIYLQSLGMSRDAFIQSLGVLFSISTVALGLALRGQGFLSPELAALSSGAVIPAIVGMLLGQLVRRRLSEATFRKVFFAGLLVFGGYIAFRALRTVW
jgi:uncharacterized protein